MSDEPGDSLAGIRATVQSIELRLRRQDIPSGSLVDLKSAIDDARRRLPPLKILGGDGTGVSNFEITGGEDRERRRGHAVANQ